MKKLLVTGQWPFGALDAVEINLEKDVAWKWMEMGHIL